MERAIVKGSKQKFALGFDSNSLGGMTLADVDFTVKFFAKELRDSKVTGVCEVPKSACVAGDGGIFFVVCDTTGLDTGILLGTLVVTYHDVDTDTDLKEKIPLVSDVRILPDEEPVDAASVSLSLDSKISVFTGITDGSTYRSGYIYVPKGHTLHITTHSPVPFSALTGIVDNNGNELQFTTFGESGASYVATANKFVALVGSSNVACFNVDIEDENGDAMLLLRNGESKTLTANIVGGGSNKKLVFSSSNDAVVDVSSRGILTSVGTNTHLPSVTIIAFVTDSGYTQVLGKASIKVHNAYIN